MFYIKMNVPFLENVKFLEKGSNAVIKRMTKLRRNNQKNAKERNKCTEKLTFFANI